VLSERFSGRRVELPSYVLVGFTAEREVRAGITTYMRVENLLGRDYETAFDRPGIPAMGSLGLAVRF
jgi:outer membrane cobalamin receptor